MTFLSPAFLWALLGLIPLVAVYFLKVRPRRQPTTALFLWQQVVSERTATRLLHRLRDIISLLLMALVLIALVLALARPQFTSDEHKDLLLLIDHSASMNAQDAGGTRLALAQDAARDVIRAMNSNQRAAVATVGDEVTYRAHFTNDPRRLLDAVDSIEPTDMPMRADALATAAPPGDWAEDYRVVLISDAVFGATSVPRGMELLKIGTPRENVGIIACDMQPMPMQANKLELYIRFASTFDEPFDAYLTFYEGQTRVSEQYVTIEPGVNEAQVLTDIDGGPGQWTVELDVDDALAQDNKAHLAVHPPRPVRVGVATDQRYFFEQSVLAFARSGDLLTLAREDEEAQVVLTQEAPPDTDQPTILFKPTGESEWWQSVSETLDTVVPRLRVEDHPALRYVDLNTMDFAGARRVEVPDDALVLVGSDQGVPLIWQVHRDGRRAVVVNIDPQASGLFFSANFPTLIHGLVTHMTGRTQQLAATYRPNETIPLPGARSGETSTITPPGGDPIETAAERFGPLGALGFYTIENSSGQWSAASSLLATEETMLDNASAQDTTQPLSRGWPPAALLIALALALLVLEEWLYHRRKVG